MFAPEKRRRERERVLALARADARISGGALTGSAAAGAEDRWSDIDLSFGVADGIDPEVVLADWTKLLEDELGVLHHWDLRTGSTIYRVFLLPGGLELDVAVTRAAEFGAHGPNFRLLFGASVERPPTALPPVDDLIGFGWLYALNARTAIARAKLWQAEYWISSLRDQALALACLRLGEPPVYARGIDRLPREVVEPFEEALVRSLGPGELRRALALATELFIRQVRKAEPELAERLRVPLREEQASPNPSTAAQRHHQQRVETVTVAERPDLTELAWERTRDVLPEYNNHGDVLNRYWGRLTEEQPDFQFHLVGAGDEIRARARSIPVRWDGSVEDLPAGIDGAIARGFDEGGANVLCALVIMVPRDLQGRGLSAVAVQAMLELTRRHGLTALIAPVRPSWKEHYPLVPIERYAAWRRADGLFFDPWMRVHERLGATVLKPEPHSLQITGTVAEWEEWTQIAFPESADYWFPGGLATVKIDRGVDRGSYWEPNAWMRHGI